jgi:hypothetical protein
MSELEGRGVAWTDERGTSDEGRRRLEAPRKRAGRNAESETATYKLASVLLQYPAVSLFDGLGELDAFAATTSPRQARAAFGRFLAWLRATPPADVAQHYVQTFDLPHSSGGRGGSSPRRQQSRCALYRASGPPRPRSTG